MLSDFEVIAKAIELANSKEADACNQLISLTLEILGDIKKKSRNDLRYVGEPPKEKDFARSLSTNLPKQTPSLSKNVTEDFDDDVDEVILGLSANGTDAQDTCTICNLTIVSDERMLRCGECAMCYHLDCHIPPVSMQEATDPRVIWNCAKCVLTMAAKKPKLGPLDEQRRTSSSSTISTLKKADSALPGQKPVRPHALTPQLAGTAEIKRKLPVTQSLPSLSTCQSSDELHSGLSSGDESHSMRTKTIVNADRTRLPVNASSSLLPRGVDAQKRLLMMKKKATNASSSMSTARKPLLRPMP